MKRDLYAQLVCWKADKNRKPLVLRGARQVGKTHLLKSFGEQEYQNYIYLNFEEDPNLGSFFDGRLEPKRILEKIGIYFNQTIFPQNTLLIFDEIQECPDALNSLKYFQEQANEFHIVAAGSLLGVKLAQTKGFPVGKVNFHTLYPLTFFEFLTALKKEKLGNFLMTLNEFKSIPEPIHNELLELLRKYFFVGGMPEAVARYAAEQDVLKIRRVQDEILAAYLLDFAKHAPPAEVMKITKVWELIASQLAKENKKFVFSALGKSARARDYETAIQWLADAGLIHLSYNISAPKLPLEGYANKNIFKVFFLDVGLLAAMSKLPPQVIIDGHKLFTEFNGAFTENFVAQALVGNQQPLYYWTSEGIAEVDFIVQHNLQVLPLEVKAGVSRKKKSLLLYGEKYQAEILTRASLMNLERNGKLMNYPLYLMNRFPFNSSPTPNVNRAEPDRE
jgi:uncharacterized protein